MPLALEYFFSKENKSTFFLRFSFHLGQLLFIGCFLLSCPNCYKSSVLTGSPNAPILPNSGVALITLLPYLSDAFQEDTETSTLGVNLVVSHILAFM